MRRGDRGALPSGAIFWSDLPERNRCLMNMINHHQNGKPDGNVFLCEVQQVLSSFRRRKKTTDPPSLKKNCGWGMFWIPTAACELGFPTARSGGAGPRARGHQPSHAAAAPGLGGGGSRGAWGLGGEGHERGNEEEGR